MGFDAIERLQIVIKDYTNFSYRGICLPQCRTHTDCLKDQDCAEDGRCLHFCSWRQRKECPNETICDLYENRCLKPCKGEFLRFSYFGIYISRNLTFKFCKYKNTLTFVASRAKVAEWTNPPNDSNSSWVRCSNPCLCLCQNSLFILLQRISNK